MVSPAVIGKTGVKSSLGKSRAGGQSGRVYQDLTKLVGETGVSVRGFEVRHRR